MKTSAAVSTYYTDEERLSMSLYDALCDCIPVTRDEIRLSNAIDREIRAERREPTARTAWLDKNREHLREYRKKRYREKHT